MSNGRDDFAGSSARHHEQTGGNVQPKERYLPFGGDAARQAEDEGEQRNEEHGIRTASRGNYRPAMQLNLPKVVGARLAEPEKPAADLSQRKASDFLPPHLKAQLIAEGKLSGESETIPAQPAPGGATATEYCERESGKPPEPAQGGVLASITRLFSKLFH
ncbi:MAG: hypothetical protein HZB13_02495 [Acidobacteria bacterium]|nr:hypothetical protein [Acidobacteriota bacterium]